MFLLLLHSRSCLSVRAKLLDRQGLLVHPMLHLLQMYHPSLLHSLGLLSPSSPLSALPTEVVPLPTTEDMNTFFRSSSSVSSKRAILALVPSYSDAYIPKSLDSDLPMVLTDLCKLEYWKLNYTKLLEKASDVTLAVSCKEVSVVEQKTRRQAKSHLWFRMCAGRITACKTNLSSPSLSLIMSVCHPESMRFCNAAT